MAHQTNLSLSLPTAVTNGIAQSQSPGASALTLNGSLVTAGVALLVTAQRIIITSGGNDSGITFRIVGTDRFGNSQSESLTGANAGTATSNLDYLTITSITPSAAIASTVVAGTNNVGSTQWVPYSLNSIPFKVSLACVVTGTVNYTVEYILDDVFGTFVPSPTFAFPQPFPHAVLNGLTTTQQGIIDFPVAAARVTLNSGSGTVRLTSIQQGIS